MEILDLDGQEQAAVTPPRSQRWARAAGAVLSPESLGLAGLLVALTVVAGSGSFVLQTVVSSVSPTAFGDQRAFAEVLVRPVLLGGALALGLAVAALVRLPEKPTTAARTLSGAAFAVALLVAVLGAWGVAVVEASPGG